MKKLLFLIAFLSPSFLFADVYKTIGNPATGKPDYVTIICPTTLPSDSYTGFYCDGTQMCMYVNGTQVECWIGTVSYALLDDNSFALLDDGGKIIL